MRWGPLLVKQMARSPGIQDAQRWCRSWNAEMLEAREEFSGTKHTSGLIFVYLCPRWLHKENTSLTKVTFYLLSLFTWHPTHRHVPNTEQKLLRPKTPMCIENLSFINCKNGYTWYNKIGFSLPSIVLSIISCFHYYMSRPGLKELSLYI